MGARIQKIKKHVRDHKEAYIAGGFGAALGAVVVLLSTRPKMVAAANYQQAAVMYKPVQTIDVHIEALGDPGNIIQDLDTGIVYASQNQAANELGVSATRLRSALQGNGDIPGHRVVKLGKAHVTE